MTLRFRIALVVAAVVTVVVSVVGVSVFDAARTELIEEVDIELLGRSRVAAGPGRPEIGAQGGFPFGRRGPETEAVRFERLISAQTFARVLDPDGVVLGLVGEEFEAPTDDTLLEAAAGEPVLSDGRIAGEDARVVTIAIADAGFLQIARPLGEIDQSLDDLRARIIVISAVAIAAAAAAAWYLATRTARPIGRLTEAAGRVAATGELDHPVDGSGGDEVGRLAASFNAMLSALAASRHQQRQLVMDASHELRTPLSSLRTNVDVLRSGRELPPDTHHAVLSDIDAELGELTELLTELVDLAADVREDEALAPVQLVELVEPVVARARRRTGRTIDVEVRRDALIEGRPESLSRAIRNLIDNAAKFSPSGSVILLTVDGGTVAVHDSGPGIPVDERERIFDRFHRVESTRTLPGSGLGLAIVRQVAEVHNGSVFVADSSEGGATVGFTVPTVDD